MLKSLRIQNLILIETAEVFFGSTLNILSGETGSGKSALMNALSLIAGERSDSAMVRRGTDKGSVEAIFNIDLLPTLAKMLETSGIDHEPDQELIIRREISISGKSRAFINHQAVQQGLLKRIGGSLIDIISQHAAQRLLSIEQHREILDLFGEVANDAKTFKEAWERESEIRKELNALKQSESERIREIGVCEMELEELAEANLKEGEEEELFTEYTLLANAEDLSTKVQDIMQALSGDRYQTIAVLTKQKATFDQLCQIDPLLKDNSEAFKNAVMELEEISYTLRHYQSRIQNEPEKLLKINARLTLINRLKRKYGSTIAEIHTYQQALKNRLSLLQNADVRIEALEQEQQKASAKTDSLAHTLSIERKQAAQRLEKALKKELKALNMAKADFIVEISTQNRGVHGDDKVEFFLIPNVGEHRIAVKEGVSGGELSRILLAIQTLLAGKAEMPTLIFDEIDANIGGETASVIGDKLKTISRKHQVLCITHFPQVASQADHHLQISKHEKGGRTVSIVRTLDSESRQEELLRMVGGGLARS